MIKKRALSWLLILALLLPLCCIHNIEAEALGEIVTVPTEALFMPYYGQVDLLEQNNRYYISQSGIDALAGTEPSTNLSDIPSVMFSGEKWYAFEAAMNACGVYVMSNGDGALYYNSVPRNIASICAEIDQMLEKQYFSANYMEDMGLLGDVSIVVANVYNVVVNFKFDAYNGHAYASDMRERIQALLMPFDSEDNFFSEVSKLNKKVKNASNIILRAQKGYENIREMLNDIPAGADVLLFGIEGTQELRTTLEDVKAINNADILDLFFQSRLNASNLKDYGQAVKIADESVFSQMNALNISDVLDICEYYVDATRVSEEYALALENVLNSSKHSASGIWNKMMRKVIYEQGMRVIDDAKTFRSNDYVQKMTHVSAELLDSAKTNIISSGLKTIVVGAMPVWATALLTLIDKGLQMGKKTDAVRFLKMYSDMQELFKDCYLSQRQSGITADNVVMCKGAAMLYLKSAWHSLDDFSSIFSTTRLKSVIEDELSLINSYPDEMFQIIKIDDEFSPGEFISIDCLDAEFFVQSDPTIFSESDSVIPLFEMPGLMEWKPSRVKELVYRIINKDSGKTVLLFSIQYDSVDEQFEEFCTGSFEGKKLPGGRRLFDFGGAVVTGQYQFIYDIRSNSIKKLIEPDGYDASYPFLWIGSSYICGETTSLSGHDPIYADIYTFDGDFYTRIIDYKYNAYAVVDGDYVYYSYNNSDAPAGLKVETVDDYATRYSLSDETTTFQIWRYTYATGENILIGSINAHYLELYRSHKNDNILVTIDRPLSSAKTVALFDLFPEYAGDM